MKSVFILILIAFLVSTSFVHAGESCPDSFNPTNYENLDLPTHWDRLGAESWSENWVSVQVTVLRTGKAKDAIVINGSSRVLYRAAERAANKLVFPTIEKECTKEINYDYQWVLK